MEKYPDIPPELYGRWWKAVNDEYGEIVKDTAEETSSETNQNEDNTRFTSNIATQQSRQFQQQEILEERGTRERPSSSFYPTNSLRNHEPQQKTLSQREEENLSDYLDLGLSITEAREQFEIEQRAAEIRLKIRDNKRNQTRGSVDATRRTATGMTSLRGRGGLSFN